MQGEAGKWCETNVCFEVKTKKMCHTYVHLLILMTLICLSCAEEKTKATVNCPGRQKAFGGSCYEFVGLHQTFFSAQAWCEQRGGHLAFITDEETQNFLQRHLDPQEDMWLGAATSASTNLQYSLAVGGKKSEIGTDTSCMKLGWKSFLMQMPIDFCPC